MALNYQKTYRKPPEKPGLLFMELFYRHADDGRGRQRKLTIRERLERANRWGTYVGKLFEHKLMTGIEWLKTPREKDDLYLEDVESAGSAFDAEDHLNQQAREEARAKGIDSEFESARGSGREEEEEPRVERMSDTGRDMGGARGERIRVTPNLPKDRMIGSDEVPTDRRVRRTDEPWPLAGPPPGDKAGRRETPETQKRVEGPEERLRITGPDSGERRLPGASVNEKPAGEVSSQRGRAAGTAKVEKLGKKTKARKAARKAARASSQDTR